MPDCFRRASGVLPAREPGCLSFHAVFQSCVHRQATQLAQRQRKLLALSPLYVRLVVLLSLLYTGRFCTSYGNRAVTCIQLYMKYV